MGFSPDHCTWNDGILAPAVEEMDQGTEIKSTRRFEHMMKPLRKRHLQIWTTMAVLLPAGIVLSWLVIPNPIPIKKLSAPHAELFPRILAEKNNAQYCVSIRANEDKTQWQLAWTNKLALTVPSAVIYQVEDSGSDISKAQLIGRIETREQYVFPLKMDPAQNNKLHLLLYDFIHEKIIDTINFNISTSPPVGVTRR
jgi:hypothetical protein